MCVCDREIKKQRDGGREIGRDREIEHERRAWGLKKCRNIHLLGLVRLLIAGVEILWTPVILFSKRNLHCCCLSCSHLSLFICCLSSQGQILSSWIFQMYFIHHFLISLHDCSDLETQCILRSIPRVHCNMFLPLDWWRETYIRNGLREHLVRQGKKFTWKEAPREQTWQAGAELHADIHFDL